MNGPNTPAIPGEGRGGGEDQTLPRPDFYRQVFPAVKGMSVSAEQAAQHPRRLLVNLHALCQQVGRRLVMGLID